MKNECDIVKDLLFSYTDGVLSSASKKFVEAHLKTCSNCQTVLEEIAKESEEPTGTKEIDPLKRVKKKIWKKNILIGVCSFFLLFFFIFHILVWHNYLSEGYTITFFLEDNITEEQISAIQQKVLETSPKAKVAYISKEDHLAKIQKQFSNSNKEALLAGYAEKNPFPASLEIRIFSKEDGIRIFNEIISMPGIDDGVTNLHSTPYTLFIKKLTTH